MPLYLNDWDDWAETPDAHEREFTVTGLPTKKGNIATEGSPLDPVPFRVALQNARTLQRAITGDETNGILTNPSTGHTHEEGYDAVMPWCQIESWRLPTSQYGGSSAATPHRLGYICSSTTFVDVLFVPFVVPLGQTKVVPVFHVYISNSNTLTLKFDFYATTDVDTSVAGGQISIGTASKDGPMVSDEVGFDLSSISTSNGSTTGYRVVYLKVQAKVSSSTAVLREVSVRFPYRDYRQKEDRTQLDTQYIKADIVPSAATLKKLYVDNPLYLRRSIFGDDNLLPSRSQAHDHGEQRGVPLRRHQLSVAYGPYNFADSGASSGGTIGIPVTYPTGVSFITTPKLLATHIISVNGQISTLAVFVGAYLQGVVATRTFGLTLELRPLTQGYEEPGDANGITNTITLSRAGSDGFDSSSTSFTDISSLGRVGQDRLFELCVWQTTDTPSTETHRLTGICVVPRTTAAPRDADLIEDTSKPATESIPTIRIRANQDINNLLTAQWASVHNQLCKEALGGVQGLRKDLQTSNTSKPWKRNIREVHQHRGSFTDTITGELVDDGAVIRRPLLSQFYAGHVNGFGAGETDSASNASPVLGQAIHAGGTVTDQTWSVFENIVSIPQGLGAIDLYAILNPETTVQEARLYCFVELYSLGTDTQLATHIKCGPYESTDNQTSKTSDEIYCEVLPIDGLQWAKNRSRLARGLGTWTKDALLPATRTTDFLVANPYRITQAIRIDIAPTYSGDHRLRIRWALQTGDRVVPLGGTYPTTPRLLYMIAIPSRGF